MSHVLGPARSPVRALTARVRRQARLPRVWLLVVTAGYVVAQLAAVGVQSTLAWDESIYVGQFGRLAPVGGFGAPRARGVTLVAAPVVSFTSSTVALRLWLVALSAISLYLAFRVWLSVRESWAVPVAMAAFVSLWATEYYGDQVMPNLYVAVGAVAAAGCAVKALRDGRRRWLVGAAAGIGWAALVRPSDGLWLLVGLAVGVAAVTGLRRLRPGALAVLALAVGFAAGALEWVIEAIVRFGGVGHRLALASGQNQTGLTFSLAKHARVINGPLLCRTPCHLPPFDWPALGWWIALPPLIAVALSAASRGGYLTEVLPPLAGGAALAAEYVLFVDYGAPRFLLPSYALLLLVAGEGAAVIGSALAARRRSPAAVLGLAAMAALAVLFVNQQRVVLSHQTWLRDHNDQAVAAVLHLLRRNGVRHPCVIGGPVPYQIAYYDGCWVDYAALAHLRPGPAPTRPPRSGEQIARAATRAAASGRPDLPYAVVLPMHFPVPASLARLGWPEHDVQRQFRVFLPPSRTHHATR